MKSKLTVKEFCVMNQVSDFKNKAFINFIKDKFNKENLSWLKHTKTFDEWKIEFDNFINL